MAKRTASAKKQARAGERRAQRNRAVRSEVKTRVSKARRSLSGGPVAESDRRATALDAMRILDRAAAKGVLHPNNAARRKSRLARQMAKLMPAGSAGSSGSGSGSGSGSRSGKRGGAASTAPAPAAPAKKK